MGSLSKPGRGNSTFPLAILTPVMPVLDIGLSAMQPALKEATHMTTVIRGNSTVRPTQDHREIID